MSLNYHLVKRKVLAGEEAGKEKYYAQIRAGKKVDFDALCQKVSLQSSATKGDVMLVLNGVISVLTEHLKYGDIVQMGELGNFRMSAGSRGADKEEEFHVSMMRRARVVFTPGKELRTVITGTQYNRLSAREVCKDPDTHDGPEEDENGYINL